MLKKSMISNGKRVLQALRSVFLCLFFLNAFFTPPQAWATEEIPTQLSTGSLLMLPYFDAYVDTTGQLSVHEIQNLEIQTQFAPLEDTSLRHEEGALWLRFTLAARQPGPDADQTFLLDLGSDLSLAPILFVAQKDDFSQEIAWEKYTPSQGSVFLLPQAQDAPITGFIRMAGIPDLWFTPFLRTPHNAATSTELFATPAAIVALVVVMVLCLLRGLTERGQWRYWAGVYTAVILFYAIVGVPSGGKGHVPLAHMAQTIAPGVALILWAHVGRHLLQTQQKSRALDLQYMALTLVGVVVALLPLVPGFVWIIHYLSLWPLLTLCFVPSTLGAWMQGLGGAKRYLVACLLPPLGVAVGLLGLFESSFEQMFFLPVAVLPALPLWGLALGILMLAGTTRARGVIFQEGSTEEGGKDPELESVESVVRSDPNLRLVPAGQAQSVEEENTETSSDTPKQASSDLEEHLRWPVEQLLRDVAALEVCALPVGAKANVGSIINTVRDIASIIDTPAKERMGITSMGGTEEHVFDLQSLLRQAHDTVSPVADKKNIALSWFMQPNLPPCYKGDALQLLFVLRLLLESSVRSTHRGAVHLIVRRVPESVNPGHLLFTVTDSGTGKPPHDRSITALARAWELSASYRGFLGVESNALGAAISFTVHYEVCASTQARESEEIVPESLPIILVSDNAEERGMWGFFLEKLPQVQEARTGDEAIALYKKHGAALLIVDVRMPWPIVQQSMQALQQESMEKNVPLPPRMGIYMDADKHDELVQMGFTHLLPMPITRKVLCEYVENILVQEQQAQRTHTSSQDAESAFEQDMHVQDTPVYSEQDQSMYVQDMHGQEIPVQEVPVQEMPVQAMHYQEMQDSDMPEDVAYVEQVAEPATQKTMQYSDILQLDLGHAPSAMPELLMPQMPVSGAQQGEGQQDVDQAWGQQQAPFSEQRQGEYAAESWGHNAEQEESLHRENLRDNMAELTLDMPQATAASSQPDNTGFALDSYAWSVEEAANEAVAQAEENISDSTPKRPTPSEDKSNAAYLTSLLDDDVLESEDIFSAEKKQEDALLLQQDAVQHMQYEDVFTTTPIKNEEEPRAEESVPEGSAVEESTAKEIVAEEAVAEKAVVEEVVAEEIVVSENREKERGTEENVNEENVAKETSGSVAPKHHDALVSHIEAHGEKPLTPSVAINHPPHVSEKAQTVMEAQEEEHISSPQQAAVSTEKKARTPVISIKRKPKLVVSSATKGESPAKPDTLKAQAEEKAADERVREVQQKKDTGRPKLVINSSVKMRAPAKPDTLKAQVEEKAVEELVSETPQRKDAKQAEQQEVSSHVTQLGQGEERAVVAENVAVFDAAAAESAATEPAAIESAATEPVATESAATEPATLVEQEQSTKPHFEKKREQRPLTAASRFNKPFDVSSRNGSISSGILDSSSEWVGEPMPIGTPFSHESRETAQAVMDEPRATSPLTDYADMHNNDVDTSEAAEKRGREELAQLRNYLDTKDESFSAHSPFEWVGDPMPMDPKRKEVQEPQESQEQHHIQEAKHAEPSITFAPMAAPQEAAVPTEPTYVQEPEPMPEPAYTPEPEFVPMPEPVYAPEPEFVQEPVPTPEPVQEPEPMPEPVYAPEPTYVQEPVPMPEPVYTPEPVQKPLSMSEPFVAPTAPVESEGEPAPEPSKPSKFSIFANMFSSKKKDREPVQSPPQERAAPVTHDTMSAPHDVASASAMPTPVMDGAAMPATVGAGVSAIENPMVAPTAPHPAFSPRSMPHDLLNTVQEGVAPSSMQSESSGQEHTQGHVENPTIVPDAFHAGISGDTHNFAMATEPLQAATSVSPIDQLLMDLDESLLSGKRAFALGDAKGVEQSAHALANHAESFGLRTLGRLARTVQAAAHAQDMEALGDLLPELDMSVQRNRAALET